MSVHSVSDIYILFYTSLLSEPPPSCLISVRNLVYSDNSWLTHLTNHFQPPFSHVKIAFREAGEFVAYYFTREGGGRFARTKGNFLHRRGFCILRLAVPLSTSRAAREICEGFYNRASELSFSLWKMSKIGPWSRFYCYLMPHDYPGPHTKEWFCSEFVAYVLHEVGVLAPGTFHCSYVSPTELFLMLLDAPSLRIQQSYNPFLAERSGISYPVTQMAETNAYDVYLSLMGLNPELTPRQVKAIGMKDALCMRFVHETAPDSYNSRPVTITAAPTNVVYPPRSYGRMGTYVPTRPMQHP